MVKTSSTKSKNNSKTDSNVNALAAFAINGIKITQSQFNWHDQQLKQKTSVNIVQLEIGQLKPKTQIPFEIQLNVQQKNLGAKINFKSGINFSSDFKQVSFHDTRLISEIKPAALKKTLPLKLTSPLITLNLDKQTANSKNIVLSTTDARLNIKMAATKILSKPRMKGQLHIETLNPRTVAKNFDITLPDIADKNVLKELNAKLDVSATLKKVALSSINITLDDTQLTGNAVIQLAPVSSVVNLNINHINVDRYLPAPDTRNNSTKKSKATAKNAALKAALIPVALLSKVNLDADVKINKLQIKKTHWKKLHLVAHAKQGKVQIKPLNLQGYGSTIKSALQLQTKEKNASVSASLTIKALKIGELLKDFMGEKNLQGLASINANINTKGTRLNQLKQNLNGKLRFNLKDGIIKGFDLEHEIKKLQAKIHRRAEPAAPSPLQTKFTNLSASALIKNGILNNKDLRAATPFTRIIGQGSINLPREQLNYVATVKLTNSRNIKNNTPFEKMNSIPLDVHIRGTFDKPDIKADFQKALGQLLDKELKKQERKIKEKIKKDLNKELQKKLGDELKKLLKF